jgi:hypothetical protein
MAKNRVDPPQLRTDPRIDLGRRARSRERPTVRRAVPLPKAGTALHDVLSWNWENIMAGYGLFVLILAVGTATAGYFWLRND